MTTKQGTLFLKKKNASIIEGLTPDTCEGCPNSTPYKTVRDKNKTYAATGKDACYDKCDDDIKVFDTTICELGCDIRHDASSNQQTELSKPIKHDIKFYRYRDIYELESGNQSDTMISPREEKWEPPHVYGNISTGYKTVSYVETQYYSTRHCIPPFWFVPGWCYTIPRSRRVTKTKKVPQFRYGITQRGTYNIYLEKRKKCHWTDVREYDAAYNLKKARENSTFNATKEYEIKSCGDLDWMKDPSGGGIIKYDHSDKTDLSGNPMKMIDNYTIYGEKYVYDCNAGYNYYERQNCDIFNNCSTVNYGSIIEHENAYDRAKEEEEDYKNVTESFTNICKSKCNNFINGVNSNDTYQLRSDKISTMEQKGAQKDCYECEKKYNPFIRNPQLQSEFVDNVLFKAIEKDGSREKDESKTNYNIYTVGDQLNKLYNSNYEIDVDIKKETENLTKKNTNHTKHKDKIREMTDNQEIKNATINAYLEDMKQKTPSKNIEYGVMIGLLVAAGVSTAMLLKD